MSEREAQTLSDTDLPAGYRWATEDETDRPDAIPVKRTADSTGRPYTQDEADLAVPDEKARLEYLRGEIRAERISYGEVSELQGLVDYIEPGDVELLEWAGVPEFPNEEDDVDRFGRHWDLPANELCDLCGQPDNTGDCDHTRLTDDQVATLQGRTSA
jgi:hypothetical protein